MSTTSTVSMDGDAERALRNLAGAAYSQTNAAPWLAATVLQRARRQRRRRHLVRGTAVTALLAGSVAAATVGGGPYYEYRQPSAAMEPTVPTGSSVVVNRDLEPRSLDITQLTLHIDGQDVQTLLRVIGTEGDVVACPPASPATTPASCTVTVNGVPLTDEYVAGLPTQPFAEVRVPDGALYLLGDARDTAVDSRMIGPVDRDDVEGVAVAVVNDTGMIGPVMGAPRHEVPDDYEIDPERPVPPASTRD